MDLGVDLNLASLWEVSNIHPAFEEKENANERRKKGESEGTFGREKTSELFSVAEVKLQPSCSKRREEKMRTSCCFLVIKHMAEKQ